MERIIVAGVCQNVEKYLPRVIQNIYKIVNHFSEYKIIIVENDSTDKTKQILDNWAWEDENVILKTVDNIAQYVPNKKYRTEYLAFCRNTYVQGIAKYSEYKYSVILDMDDVMSSESFGEQGILHSLKLLECNPKIGALTAISRPKYYDIWALRSSKCNYDCWKKVFWSMKHERLDYESAVEKYVRVHAKDYSQYTDLISVQSAFNGLAVYRNSALVECKYIGIIDGINSKTSEIEFMGAEICEHVPMCNKMRSLGYSIYINPYLVCG